MLQIEQGYNKDGRPECRQVVVGQIVNGAGIPVFQKIQDGSMPHTAAFLLYRGARQILKGNWKNAVY